MIVLKWIIIVGAIGYLGCLVALFFAQRALLFPIPQTVRTSPEAAGFPEAEEHVLTTADGEKIIIWHVPAKPGHAVVVYFPGNADLLAGRVSRFRGITSDGTGLVAVSYRGYAGSSGQRARQDCFWTPRRPMPSQQRDTSPIESSSGAFRLAAGLR
jgi:uncharacterized protein